MTDAETCRAAMQAAAMRVHLAAIASVPECCRDWRDATSANLRGTVKVLWAAAAAAWHSFSIMERAFASPWRPILFPYRAVIPLCALLLIIQGISELLKAVFVIRAGSAR